MTKGPLIALLILLLTTSVQAQEGSPKDTPTPEETEDGSPEEEPLVIDDEEEPLMIDDEEDPYELSDDPDGKDPLKLGPIDIVYTHEDIAGLGGAANLIDEEALEELEYDDPHSVLLQVPGLYVRQEDAFGLRPNIGLRGANSDRSKKVTLMEDGILLGPAPYAAPAAYYFPIMTRMTGVEVFKGPGAIMYGPNTIGGAVNLKTRAIPTFESGGVDLALGSFATGKMHGHYGDSSDWGGFLVEMVHLRSDGIKDRDSSFGSTGFNKSELMVKLGVNSDLDGEIFHRLELKLGAAREVSNETYLGLSDADFESNPYRRYAASARDRMEWLRTQIHLTHKVEHGDDLDLTTTAYRHDFTRAWRKINGFKNGPELSTILADPTGGRRQVFYDVLTGAEDSSSEAETLILGTNDRTYFSQGVQTIGRWRASSTSWSNTLEIGLRLHSDQVERNHTEDGFLMTNGLLVADGGPTETATLNEGSALAFAAYAFERFSFADFTIAPGVRLEVIETELENKLTGEPVVSNAQQVVIPGLGVHYAIQSALGVFAGVHRGFSPVSPGQSDGVEPETSINYEAGVRYLDQLSGLHAEVIGFFNDYNNLTGECTFSAGCNESQLDSQFNAGEVDVYGLEVMAAYRFALSGGYALPARLAYTYTQSEFQSAFISVNPQFGEVEVGDALPYVPEHQASLGLGLDSPRWGVNVGATFVDEMREQAGQGELEEGEATDRYMMVDVKGHVAPVEELQLYLKVDNVTQAEPIVSRRPFGARPSRPFLMQAGVKYAF